MDPTDLVKAYMVNTKTSISVLNMYIPTHTTEKLWAKWNLSPHMTEQKTPNRQCMENLNNTRKHVTDKIINRLFFSLLSTYTPTSHLQYMYFYCLISVFLSDALGYGLCITSPQYLLHPHHLPDISLLIKMSCSLPVGVYQKYPSFCIFKTIFSLRQVSK